MMNENDIVDTHHIRHCNFCIFHPKKWGKIDAKYQRRNCNDKLQRVHKFVYVKNKFRIRHVVRSKRPCAQLIYARHWDTFPGCIYSALCIVSSRQSRERAGWRAKNYVKMLFLPEALAGYGVDVGISYAFCATANSVHTPAGKMQTRFSTGRTHVNT